MNITRPPIYHAGTGSTKSPSVYQSIPTSPSPYTTYTTYPVSQPFDESLLPSRKQSQTIRVLLITLLLALVMIIPIIAWAWYVFVKERTIIDRVGLQVYTTAGPTQFLLLSTVSTTVTKILLAPLMALHAYTASADWLLSSSRGLQHRLPSPIHLASLLSLFQGASFLNLASTSLGAFKRRQLAWPPILKRAVALLVWLLFLAYSLTVISFWLQIDAKPTSNVPATTNFPSLGYTAQNTLFSRTVNQTLCAEENAAQLNSVFRAPACGLADFSATNQSYTSSRAAQVMTNNSAESRVAWLNDNIAILVPATPPIIGYMAKALGVRASCNSVTNQCVSCNGTQPNTIVKCEGPLSGPVLACAPSAKVNVTTDARGLYFPSGPISKVNGSEIYRDFNANPFAYGDVITSAAYLNQSLVAGGLDYFVGSTGFLVHGRAGAINVMYCDVAVYDVTYESPPPETYTSTSWKLSDITTAGYVAFGMTTWFTSAGRGFDNIDGAGQSGLATYPEVYSRQLSKIGIATTARIVPPTSADQLLAGRVSGTQVTLVGMALLFAVIGLIILTTIAIGAHAAIVIFHTDSNFIATARGRLISVYPLIGDSFGGLDFDFQNHKSATSAAMDDEAFLPESEADRLHLVQDDVDGGPVQGRTVRLRPRRG